MFVTSRLPTALLCFSSLARASQSALFTLSTLSAPGDASNIQPTVTSSSLSFGQHYAVLNLDLITGLVSSVNTTAAGKSFINNTATWINAVHAQSPPPLSIFTRIYFNNVRRPEIGPTTPFAKTVAKLGNITSSSPESQLYPAFVPLADYDAVLQKTGYYAGYGNSLEQILSQQKIDTVILSGIRTSGVILATTYRLFDLGYHVYVISNNTLETPPIKPAIDAAILERIIPKLPAHVITIEQALGALNRSRPAMY